MTEIELKTLEAVKSACYKYLEEQHRESSREKEIIHLAEQLYIMKHYDCKSCIEYAVEFYKAVDEWKK